MAQLTMQQRQDRLRFDYAVATKMRSHIMTVTAYRSTEDLDRRRNPIVSEADGHLATHYLVDYRIRSLIGRGVYHDKFSVKFDLLANGNYPYSRPGCYVISTKMPWTPHFKEHVPVCVDHDLWEASQGKMLLGQLMVHVAKLLNFDEIPRSDNYGGYNPDAAEYWRSELQRQPINPQLVYPPLPAEISSVPDPVIRPKATDDTNDFVFRPKSAATAEREIHVIDAPPETAVTAFRPATAPISSSMFTPKRRSVDGV